MKAARLVVLGVALVAGVGAAYLTMGSKPPPEPVHIVAPAPPPVPKDGVLVAARDLSFGDVISGPDLRWQPWPRDQVPPGVIQQSMRPAAVAELSGQKVNSRISAGDPIHADHLGSTFLSAALAPGMRAVAIDLADQGKTSAGGFIEPNDRVDVIRTFHPDDAPAATASETILTNIRVLAIGQNIEGKNKDPVVIGGTATLALTPEQAEKAVLAQRTGQLTLSLRSMADAPQENQPAEDPKTMTIIRFGNASQSRVR